MLKKEEIDLIVLDFDGVLTDNYVYVDQNGMESVRCNRSDGLGINILKKLGIRVIILSTESNPVVSVRASKLEIEVYQGVGDKGKAEALIRFCMNNSIDLKRVLYIGNDINDIPPMQLVGYKVVPADAYEEVIEVADIIMKTKGGDGVVRELALMLDAEQ